MRHFNVISYDSINQGHFLCSELFLSINKSFGNEPILNAKALAFHYMKLDQSITGYHNLTHGEL